MPDNTLTKRTWLDKFLDGLERVCNKLPPPAIMFIYLFVIVAVISALLSLAGVSAVNPSTEEVVALILELLANYIPHLQRRLDLVPGEHAQELYRLRPLGPGHHHDPGHRHVRGVRPDHGPAPG